MRRAAVGASTAVAAALFLAAGCGPTAGSCSTDLATSGPLALDLGGENVACSGSSDNLDTFVDLGWSFGTTYIDVEYDDLVAGETGEYEALVAVDDRDDEWRARCPSTIREHSHLGGSIWQLEVEVRCASLAADALNDTAEPLTITGGTFTLVGWHSRYEY